MTGANVSQKPCTRAEAIDYLACELQDLYDAPDAELREALGAVV